MIYTSSLAKSAMPTDLNFLEKLDFILSKHIEQMTSEEFASVCNSIAFSDSHYHKSNDDVLFQSFLKDAAPQAEQYLRENAFSLEDLPSVVLSYSLIRNQLEPEN